MRCFETHGYEPVRVQCRTLDLSLHHFQRLGRYQTRNRSSDYVCSTHFNLCQNQVDTCVCVWHGLSPLHMCTDTLYFSLSSDSNPAINTRNCITVTVISSVTLAYGTAITVSGLKNMVTSDTDALSIFMDQTTCLARTLPTAGVNRCIPLCLHACICHMLTPSRTHTGTQNTRTHTNTHTHPHVFIYTGKQGATLNAGATVTNAVSEKITSPSGRAWQAKFDKVRIYVSICINIL